MGQRESTHQKGDPTGTGESISSVFPITQDICTGWELVVVRELEGPETSLEGKKIPEDALWVGSGASPFYAWSHYILLMFCCILIPPGAENSGRLQGWVCFLGL